MRWTSKLAEAAVRGAMTLAVVLTSLACGRTDLWSSAALQPADLAGDDGDPDDAGDVGDAADGGDTGTGPLDLGLPFNTNVSANGFDGPVYALAIDPQTHAVYVGGGFTHYGSTAVGYIVRLLPDGALDPAFATTASFDNEVYALVADGNGGFFAGGAFTTYAGAQRAKVARVHADGVLDATFVPGAFDSEVLTIAYDEARDRLYAGGWFTTYAGASANRIIRLMPDGSRDAAFNIGTGFESDVENVHVAGDTVYVSGWFSTYAGATRVNVARLLLDGSVDPAFNANLQAANWVRPVAVTTDRVILGGSFFRIGESGTSVCHARLGLGGQLAAGYDPTTADDFDSTVSALLVAGTDSLWAAGDFSGFGSVSAGRIARLRLDGSLDPSFQPGVGLDDAATALALDGEALYVGGRFTSYNGAAVSRVVRLAADGALTP